MKITFPTVALFALFLKRPKGEEFILVRDDALSGDWDLPNLTLRAEPDPHHLEMALDKYFKSVAVASIERIDASELKRDEASFLDSPLYACTLASALSRIGMVFYMKKQTEPPSPLSERARIVFSLPLVQSRLT